MPSKDPEVIEINSDSDDDSSFLITPATSVAGVDVTSASEAGHKAGYNVHSRVQAHPGLPGVYSPKNANMVSKSAPTKRSVSSVSSALSKSVTVDLPKSCLLAGKAFMFRGAWATMSLTAAEELCGLNGGKVVQAVLQNPTYVVVGKRGTSQSLARFEAQGGQIISEADFFDMILRPPPNTSTTPQPSSSAGSKRTASASDEDEDKDEKPAKKPKNGKGRKAIMKDEKDEEEMIYIKHFLSRSSNEIRFKRRTLEAFDGGGTMKKIQRGKSYVSMLRQFEEWLQGCDGDYHQYGEFY